MSQARPGTRLALIAAIVVAHSLSLACSRREEGALVRVALAANVATTFEGIAAVCEAPIEAVRGSSGKLAAQIEHGAPFDLFISADTERPRRLEGLGLVAEGQRATYAIGTLVLWSPATADPRGALLASTFARIALANPRHAPYGVAALETLDHLHLEIPAEQRVIGESIGQTYQLIATGAAPAGFVALAQLRETSAPGGRWIVPGDHHAPIVQDAAVLAQARDPDAARRLFECLLGPIGRERLRAAGYSLPDAPAG